MSVRPGIRTPAACALLLLALILGARRVGRELASPFEGLDRLTRARPAAEPEAEIAGPIDWEDSTTPVVADRPKPAVTPAAPAEMTLKPSQALLVSDALRVASFTFPKDLDIDSLASSLKLSESQKARLSNLIEWRKSTLDALKEVEGADETVKAIDDTYRAAVEAELDPAQALTYRKMTESAAGVVLVRVLSELALTQVETRTRPQFIQDLLKSFAQERASSGE